MALKDNGREVVLHTIYGKSITLLICAIIKGEYFVHGNSEYYQFWIKGERYREFFIDYPEKMKYPKTLRMILSGRNIVTHKFNPDVEYETVHVKYEDKLAYTLELQKAK